MTSTSHKQLQTYTFTAKYARWNADLGRRETPAEAVDRVLAMHQRKFQRAGVDVSAEIEDVRSAMKEDLVLGSQRALQFGGKPIEDKEARIYNCTVSFCDRPRFFQEAEWLLLCGCGVGFSVQTHHIERLPEIATPTGEPITYAIPDTIEGWADAVGVLVSSYFVSDQPFPEYANRPVEFDFSRIRPAGAKLGSSGGKAPGPKPLMRALEMIREVIVSRLTSVGSPCRLRPIDCYDMVMHGSDAVLAGGVRRSATICIFSAHDPEMMAAKTGDWFVKNPQRGRSNNSVMLLRDQTTREQFMQIMESVKEFGEPGFVWSDSTELMVNPCVEIGMYPVDVETGETGWQFCNLCEINGKLCTTRETFLRACRAAALLGTMQAAYTSFPYLGAASEKITRREALLGCSMTGMMDSPDVVFNETNQRDGAALILATNEAFAAKIGVNPAARATCVKPAGTTSCILGTSSGIHAHHARRYLRRVQANKLEAPYQYFREHNPLAVEDSVWNPNGTDGVITFCIEPSPEAKTRREIGAIDLLRLVKLTQDNWVDAGKRTERCAQSWLSHNVSNTITVRSDEWQTVGNYIFDNRAAFAGVSLLSESGDLDYPQAPFVDVWSSAEIEREFGVGSMFASGLIVDGLRAYENNLWKACDAALGIGEKDHKPRHNSQTRDGDEDPDVIRQEMEDFRRKMEAYHARMDFIRRAKKFAANYFGGDVRKMTYCLKRIQIAKTWEDLRRVYVPVDYTLMPEREDGTLAVELDSACAGGKCII
jgi:ribonucleoside-diphosphate reductase alpha chain